jgi:hypothetical protein
VRVATPEVVGQVLGQRDLLFEGKESVRVHSDNKRSCGDGPENVFQ